MQKVSTKPTILVTGATGQQGGAVAKALIDGGTSFRAMSRSPQKLTTLKEQGIETCQGTLNDQKTLKEALSGMKQAYLVTTPFEEGVEAETKQGINFVNAAKEAGIEHLIFSSVGAADKKTGIPHFESKWKIEQHIKNSGIPATILRPVFFMENFASPWFFPALQKGNLALPIKESVELQMVCLDVIGEFAVMAFNNPSEFIGQTIELASDSLTLPEAVEKISRESGKAITYEVLPESQSEKAFGSDFAKMFKWFNEVGYSADFKNLEKYGVPLIDFDSYLAHADWVKKL